ncbi:hypothetical protein LVD17_19840 [Fulvivirga ulvae]|uniref:hypothetical protein n=1 Tax=Fulvivirga ulvae TaxID=2904245 RepID=UPI001F39024E|nr:hypothetical protein [Fulvivirga ulvae]UII30546.1 hypothetical protein LVD17_19840 [Fulvivirga ulvae]
MKAAKSIFHYLSYLQYPFIIIALFYAYKPLISDLNTIWDDFNKVLIFMGLGISLSTLQDTKKVQNKLSKKIWENPKYSRVFLIYLFSLIIIVIAFGLYSLLFTNNKHLQEISSGVVVFGIGLIGLLKTAIEMAENHRKDQTIPET